MCRRNSVWARPSAAMRRFTAAMPTRSMSTLVAVLSLCRIIATARSRGDNDGLVSS